MQYGRPPKCSVNDTFNDIFSGLSVLRVYQSKPFGWRKRNIYLNKNFEKQNQLEGANVYLEDSALCLWNLEDAHVPITSSESVNNAVRWQ